MLNYIIVKRDVENIFKHHPDLTEYDFLNMVLGSGDEGYDRDTANEMFDYYCELQTSQEHKEI